MAFLFEEKLIYPPTIDDMKVFYISRELIRRKSRVTWVQFRGPKDMHREAQIDLVTIPVKSPRLLRPLLIILHVLAFCLASDVKCAYIDEWLMFRSKAGWQLVLRFALRIIRVKTVFDLRDPYVDYQVAYGSLNPKSLRYGVLSRQYALIYRLTDLIVLPSEVYAETFEKENDIPKQKMIGIPRGIDSDFFNPRIEAESTRAMLGLGENFVIG